MAAASRKRKGPAQRGSLPCMRALDLFGLDFRFEKLEFYMDYKNLNFAFVDGSWIIIADFIDVYVYASLFIPCFFLLRPNAPLLAGACT